MAFEARDLAWASDRVAMLKETAENKGVVIYMTEEMAGTICNLGENDPSVPLIEAQYGGMLLASLKQIALTIRANTRRKRWNGLVLRGLICPVSESDAEVFGLPARSFP
jgi:hypothetical protein